VNLLLDLEILGWLLVGLAAIQGVPVAAAWLEGGPVLPYAASAVTALVFGLPVALSTRGPDRRLRTRDAFLVVSASWVLASAFGALPYVFTGVLDPAGALFESVAGFTTTGSTALVDVEACPDALLLWRSLSQWLGGVGIVVFTVAVLPLLGIGGMQLFKAEVPGPTTDKLTPRVAGTARRLWIVYLGLTVAAFLALRVAGMGWFDALCHAFTTLATGGFSTRNASIGAFGAPVQWVVTFFMFAAGVNFVLHYRLATGRGRGVLADPELRFYLTLLAGFIAAVAWNLHSAGVVDPVRVAAFQVVSLLTTTGFGTADYEQWPALSRLLIVPLLVVGGMAGSTAGGLKSMRLLLGWRSFRSSLSRFVHPHLVKPVHYADRSVPDEVVNGVGVFFTAYLLVMVVGAVSVGLAGYDIDTAFSAAATTVSNVGPGLSEVGPTDNFAHFPAYTKLVLCGCMIAGRLEIFTLLVLFSPAFWRR
jgi:trk system potassium uptake protein TrkH